MKIRYKIFFWLIILGIIFIGYRINRVFPLMTGYTAKYVCSSVFISKISPEKLIKEDLNFFPVKFVNFSIDNEKKQVSSTIFGLALKTAVYKEGCGCVLGYKQGDEAGNIKIQKPKEIINNPFSIIPVDSLPDTLLIHKKSKKIKKYISDVIEKNNHEKEGIVRALMIIKDSVILAEEYAEGFNNTTRFPGWSMTKSIMNSIAGIMIKKGQLQLAQPAEFNKWQTDERKNISLNNLLQMTDGLEWEENYSDISDITKLLYSEKDVVSFAISHNEKYIHGSNWKYSSGTSNILSGLYRKILNNDSVYYSFPYKELFYKIGMNSIIMETDRNGNFIGSSYSLATARDWVNFGLLYLNDGKCGDEYIFPSGWTKYTASVSKPSNGKYGAHFWLNSSKVLKDCPDDMYMCKGYNGQRIFILPSEQMVILVLGILNADIFDYNKLISEVIYFTN